MADEGIWSSFLANILKGGLSVVPEILNAIARILEQTKGVMPAIVETWKHRHRLVIATETLDAMFRNRKYRFRSRKVLSLAINGRDDDPEVMEAYHSLTVVILKSMKGVRANTNPRDGAKDTWTNDNYWEEKPNGTWALKAGVTAGHI